MSDEMTHDELHEWMRRVECTHAPGRLIPQPIMREFLRALGVLTCAECAQVTAILGRRARVVENPK
jgi:hypothetical protein